MKTKLQILVLLMLFFNMAVFTESVQAADPSTPVISNELPSTAYLKKEKRSIATTTEGSALASPIQGINPRAGGNWDDPFLPGEGETSNPGNVGAPIGDATWPIILSIFLIYMLYRSVTTSRKRHNL